MTQEALKLALDALIWTTGSGDFGEGGYAHEGAKKCLFPAITAIKEALAQEQEPVAWMWKDMRGQEIVSLFEPRLNSVPLYTHLPQRTWVGLTYGQIDACWNKDLWKEKQPHHIFAKAIEAKLKDKNS